MSTVPHQVVAHFRFSRIDFKPELHFFVVVLVLFVQCILDVFLGNTVSRYNIDIMYVIEL